MKEWISQAEASRLRGVSRQAISKLVRKGKIRTLTIGGHILVHIDDVTDRQPNIGRSPMETELVRKIKYNLSGAPDQDRKQVFDWLRQSEHIHPLEKEFGASAEVILEAIARSSDLTKRGVRGIIAEAVFKLEVLEPLGGWHDITPDGELPYDFLISDGARNISIQVKMQRRKEQRPMMAQEGYRNLSADLFVVETQRTRGGKTAEGADTRPYHFGEFDLLAVSMHPSTGNWKDFRYTVGAWLLARPESPEQLLKFQPVSLEVNDDWTNDIEQAVAWLDGRLTKKIGGRISLES